MLIEKRYKIIKKKLKKIIYIFRRSYHVKRISNYNQFLDTWGSVQI